MDDKYISRINDYLFYGYAPNDIELEWLNLIEVTEAEEKLHYSSSEVAQVLDSCIDDLLPEQVSKCVIPLSGGWDSRVLFGAAMERYDRSRLVAVSFGSPGLLDYDIGQSIAKKFAVPHFAVDLRKITFVWEELLASVLESPWTYATVAACPSCRDAESSGVESPTWMYVKMASHIPRQAMRMETSWLFMDWGYGVS